MILSELLLSRIAKLTFQMLVSINWKCGISPQWNGRDKQQQEHNIENESRTSNKISRKNDIH